jgi:hypothetical protein
MEKKLEALFDNRVVERHIGKGLTDQAAYEAYLASLEDVADKARNSDVKFTHSGFGRRGRTYPLSTDTSD